MPIDVRLLDPGFEALWDQYVLTHPHGTPFHLLAWKRAIHETFGYRPLYLLAAAEGKIRGVLPLFEVSNWMTGKALLSSPFATYGGALTDGPDASAAMKDAVASLGRTLGVEYVELRNWHAEQALGFTPVSRHVIYSGPLHQSEDAILQGLPRKTRRIVRNALAEPFTTRIAKDGFAAFADLYARNLRRLGTPMFPKRYFAALLRNFRGSIDIREVLLKGKPVAGVLTFYFRDQVMPYYGAADPAYNAQAPSSYMYYDLMRCSARNGYRVFDFGRSKIDSGSGHFKAHWGLEERPLHYEVLLVKRRSIPNYTPNNARFDWPIRIWQHTPLAVTRIVGPHLVRLVP